ncbi:putative metalloprotease CJM1_0395 family protein [Simiduia agarivorans]|uniref:SrpA-like protein n=1 Tax=Simiduia agarivorans (strain DSM 21679 / JCM 13881 / BCRC 17597 / SA1) TaxID=1117647 RepID=K4KJM1_SIMAS|nr:putative metalloprotease CJM1_0395 family protein [Simiduia agarivorans]AFU99171.1 srpA-like protein [Simiduia agarivorans SA1 = DSM 21679]
MSVNFPASFANQVAPFNPLGRQPVGEEGVDKRETSFKAVTETEETAAGQNRTDRDDRNRDQALSARLSGAGGNLASPAEAEQSPYERDQALREQREIEQLAARDREVRAHERAHASVGGQHTGAPSFNYVRGPDGVSYAVSGEVSVSLSSVPGNPEATLRKAEQIQQAALAPADPSPQDRQVAAQAARMAEQARVEIRVEQQEMQREDAAEKEAAREARAEEERRRDAERAEREEAQRLAEEGRRAIDLNRRLLDIGISDATTSPGSLLDQTI